MTDETVEAHRLAHGLVAIVLGHADVGDRAAPLPEDPEVGRLRRIRMGAERSRSGRPAYLAAEAAAAKAGRR